MPAFSLSALVSEWVADELTQQSTVSGEEFGHEAVMLPVQTPQGDAVLWVILVTLRSPYLGEDVIGYTAKLQANLPAEASVRLATRNSCEALRKTFEQRKREGYPKGNGHSQDLPAGLKGLKL